jgi:hypothetical protein
MARKGLLIRGKNGQYIKNTFNNVVKYFCNFIVAKITKLCGGKK